MGGTIEFLVKYGYIVVFVSVLAEQIGWDFQLGFRIALIGSSKFHDHGTVKLMRRSLRPSTSRISYCGYGRIRSDRST
jgi:hypothetical protein